MRFAPVIAASAAMLAVAVAPGLARAAAFDYQIDGAKLGLGWAVPFAGLLLTIALAPLLAPRLWHGHYGKIAGAWAMLLVLPFFAAFGPDVALHNVVHTLLIEYTPFVIVLFTLYTVSGGIRITGGMAGSPWGNTALLVSGMLLASLMGTTGATMLLVRPLLRANAWRKRQVHLYVFFIFLVGNIGGSMTALGDPPLFIGFLRGVDFFWPAKHLFHEFLMTGGILVTVFFLLDWHIWRQERGNAPAHQAGGEQQAIGIEGGANVLLLLLVPPCILLSATWQPAATITIVGNVIGLQAATRDALLLAIAVASLLLTPRGLRAANGFSWAPIAEVAKLFACIFLTIMPVLAMLRAGPDGAFAPLLAAVTDPSGAPIPTMYFWLTGLLSSFLDNAPTYLVFFEMAGGDPEVLMTERALTLTAISAGAVFMGAMTYIGNAPNFMVKAVVEHAGVKMPGFLLYMVWAMIFLLPVLVLLDSQFFR
ncbi:MAG: sodium:proton antiporter [Alphaproteobacteria bacterium]|nr:sodium:proton antiporter [Alphaproteobacteria bacterium]